VHFPQSLTKCLGWFHQLTLFIFMIIISSCRCLACFQRIYGTGITSNVFTDSDIFVRRHQGFGDDTGFRDISSTMKLM
jgi:hypothetical protein